MWNLLFKSSELYSVVVMFNEKLSFTTPRKDIFSPSVSTPKIAEKLSSTFMNILPSTDRREYHDP